VIGKTVVETGLVIYKESLKFVKEVEEKGFVRNIIMKLKAPDERIHFITINTIPLSTAGEVCWLTVGTETSPFKRATKTLQDDIIKTIDSYEDGGFIVITLSKNNEVSLLYANKKAKNILKKYSLDKLVNKLGEKVLTYIKIEAESYYVRRVGKLNSISNVQLITIHKFPFDINYEQILEEFELTPRQREVAFLALSGKSNAEIAKKLFVSEFTVKDHLKEIFRILDIHNRSELFPKMLNM